MKLVQSFSAGYTTYGWYVRNLQAEKNMDELKLTLLMGKTYWILDYQIFELFTNVMYVSWVPKIWIVYISTLKKEKSKPKYIIPTSTWKIELVICVVKVEIRFFIAVFEKKKIANLEWTVEKFGILFI